MQPLIAAHKIASLPADFLDQRIPINQGIPIDEKIPGEVILNGAPPNTDNKSLNLDDEYAMAALLDEFQSETEFETNLNTSPRIRNREEKESCICLKKTIDKMKIGWLLGKSRYFPNTETIK